MLPGKFYSDSVRPRLKTDGEPGWPLEVQGAGRMEKERERWQFPRTPASHSALQGSSVKSTSDVLQGVLGVGEETKSGEFLLLIYFVFFFFFF